MKLSTAQRSAMTSEWISVDDRLPENPKRHEYIYDEVIVYAPDYGRGLANPVQTGRWTGHQWQVAHSPSSWTVTHWMPLPEPPK